MNRFVRTCGLAVALLVVTAPPAMAANKQVRERAARKACLSGDYAKGMDILSDLFVETQDAVYIFNQGRCLEQNQQYKDAIARFQEYLRTGESHTLKPGDQALAEKHIASCKENLANQLSETQTSAPPPPLIPPPAAPAPSPGPTLGATPLPVVTVQPGAATTPAHAGSGLRTAGVIVAAFGVAAAGAGVGLNVLANNTIGDMEAKKDAYSDAKNSSHNTYVTLAWVGYGVGAACVIGGTVLYALGLKAESSAPANLALVPTIGPGQAGAAFIGAFQ